MVLLAFIAACLIGVLAEARIQSPLLVGGNDVAIPGTWPWQASLQIAANGNHGCGAVLISDVWLLSAAHCVGSSPSTYRIVVGLHDRVTVDQGKPLTYMVESIIRHPDFAQDASQGFPNDIAVIRVTQAVDFSRYAAPATLPPVTGAPDYAGLRCFISGWGRLVGSGPLPNILQEAEVSSLTQADCDTRWSSTPISNVHICAMDVDNLDKGTCNGDSGGPLMCNTGTTENPSWTVVGISSWGRPGCIPTYPSVYARISTFRQWIRDQTGV